MSPVRPEVTVIGHRLDPTAYGLRDLFTRGAQPHRFLEAGTPEADAALADADLPADAPLPVLIEVDKTMAPASVARIAEAWRLSSPPSSDHYDIAIIGGGPAGLAAAVYAASDGLSTLLADSDLPGGQAGHTSMIENFLGFPDGIGGAELARLAGRQAEKFGAELTLLRGVIKSDMEEHGPTRLFLAGDVSFTADAVIAAPGMDWRRLEVEGVAELLGRGVYYGAGRSEALQCANDAVAVVGAGNSAGQAAMYLADAGAHVTMVVRGSALGASMSGYLVDRIGAHPNIDLRLLSNVTAVCAEEDHLAGITITEEDGRAEDLRVAALFLCIGGVPRTGWAADEHVRTDAGGFILTGAALLERGERPDCWPLDRDPFPLETTRPGLFAAGDVRSGSAKRVAGAAGDGAGAVAQAHQRLAELAR
jgi:thioredoxin reductase (NADPH)